MRATCMALALRASFMFASRELKPVAGIIEHAPQAAARSTLPAESAVIVQLRPRLSAPRFASNATASLAFARAA